MSKRYVIDDFNLFGGLHCETSAVRKVFLYNDLPISEEMLFGLGGGIGFIYWYMKQMPAPMVGGRGGGRYFIEEAARRAGATLKVQRTTSSKKGHRRLLEKLASKTPAVIYADMAYLPYMGVPEDAHFGQHVFVVYGVDEDADTVYISDRAKRGVTVTVDELKRARASKFPPWPPQHAIFDFSLPSQLTITQNMVREALHQTVEGMRNPPIRNIGLKGIQKWAKLILKWPDLFHGEQLWQALYQGFIYIETGGTGGSAFRPMFTRYLREVHEQFPMKGMEQVIAKYEKAGQLWSDIAISYLPNKFAMLRKVREWILKQSRVGEAQETGALRKMQKINHEIDSHKGEIFTEIAHAPEFLQTTQEKILQLYEVEKEAIQLLHDVMQ